MLDENCNGHDFVSCTNGHTYCRLCESEWHNHNCLEGMSTEKMLEAIRDPEVYITNFRLKK